MGQLLQPELKPGPHRDLVDALHRLHDEAGQPSLRAISRRAGCSHTTVSHLFSHPRLPAWSLLEMVVTAIGGDPADFRDLWLAATADGARHLPPPARTIAGRRAELLVVRRHLEAGRGLLVVTGEPGIGKTTLLAAASQQVSTFVARAGGLPILADAPFALVSDVMRRVWLDDGGRWFGEALGRCPGSCRRSGCRVVTWRTASRPLASSRPSSPPSPRCPRSVRWRSCSRTCTGPIPARAASSSGTSSAAGESRSSAACAPASRRRPTRG